MRKSVMVLAVVFLAMAISSVAFGEVQIVDSSSTSFNTGLVAAQLYLNDSNQWVQQMKLYNGTAFPGYDHPCYTLAAGMTYENTIASSNSRVRYPATPYVFPADMSTQAPVAYYIFGDAEVLATVKSALSATGLSVYYGEAPSQIVETTAGFVNTAVIYGIVSGSLTFFPVYDSSGKSIFNSARLKAILAADSFRF